AFQMDVLEEMWKPDFPHAQVEVLDAGHYIQEDAHDRVIPLLLDFISRDRGDHPLHAAAIPP
ncbi:MAG: hypothetical protein AAGI15_07610, partial [Pseudomonadota bacterium]